MHSHLHSLYSYPNTAQHTVHAQEHFSQHSPSNSNICFHYLYNHEQQCVYFLICLPLLYPWHIHSPFHSLHFTLFKFPCLFHYLHTIIKKKHLLESFPQCFHHSISFTMKIRKPTMNSDTYLQTHIIQNKTFKIFNIILSTALTFNPLSNKL